MLRVYLLFMSLVSFVAFTHADTIEDTQSNAFRKVKCLDGEWEITSPQHLRELVSYKEDKVFKNRWVENKNNDDTNTVNVPLNIFYKWTGSKPVWNPENVTMDPLEGCRGLYEISKRCESLYKKDDNYIVTWYRCIVNFESNFCTSKRIELYFAGIALESEIFVNGKYVGRHNGGFTSFSLNVYDYVQSGPNVIAVRCIIRRGAENFILWGNGLKYYGGIWRSVYLIGLPQEAINKILIDPQPAQKKLSCRVRLHSAQEKTLLIKILVCEKDSDDLVTRAEHVFPKGEIESRFNIPFDGTVWSPENPKLYTMKVIVSDSTKVLDQKIVRFGFRSFEALGNKLYLNGKPYRFFGYGENGNHFGGEGYSNDAVYQKYKALCQTYRGLGANSVRWHNNIISEQARAADEVGLAIYAGWGYASFLYEHMRDDYWNYVKEFVEQHYNNPSVLMWHFSNENWQDKNVPLMRKIYDYTRSIDTSGRPIVPDSGSYSFPDYGFPSISTGQFVIDIHNYSGVAFGIMGSSQKVAFTKTKDVMNNIFENVSKIIGKGDRPYIIGECQAQLLWSLFSASNWQGPDQGGYYRKCLGSDGLVRPEILDEISLYSARAGIGHGVKHVGLVSYMNNLYQNPNKVDADIASWTHSEIIKDCFETYRLMPVSGMFLNQGEPTKWMPKEKYCLKTQARGNFLFSRLMPIVPNLKRQLFSGSQVDVEVFTDNCTQYLQQELQLAMRIDDSNRGIIYECPPQAVPDIKPQDKSVNKFSIKIPSNFSGIATVRLLLSNQTDIIAENFYHISVSPPLYKEPLLVTEHVLVWQPDSCIISDTIKVLKDLKINYRTITSKELLSSKFDANWLIIPAHSIYQSKDSKQNSEWSALVALLSERLKNGLNILVLEQFGEGGVGIIPGLNYFYRPGNVTADPVMFDHPVLARVPWHKWWIWSGNSGDIAPFVMTLGKNSLAIIGSHADDRVYSILSEGKSGNGRIILSQADAVSRWTEDGGATSYIYELMHYALKSSVWPRVQDFQCPIRDYAVEKRERLLCINLKPYFNRVWSDDKPLDNQGGWTDEGRNDFSHFNPPRMAPELERYQFGYAEHLSNKVWLLELPFDIPNDGNRHESCIVVGAGKPNEIGGIKIEAKAKTIFFLGTATNNGKGKFIIHYENGESVEVPSRFPDWWNSTDLGDVRVAWRGENPKSKTVVGCYIQPWDNPKPQIKINSVDINGDHLVLLGVTVYRSDN